MNYRRICLDGVSPGDDVILPDGVLFRVTSVNQGSDAVCLSGYHFAHTGFVGILLGSFTDIPESTVILVASVVGRKVRMSASLKEKLGGPCRKVGRHVGPFDSDDEDKKCYSCSWEHVQEFENSVGVVRGLADYNNCKPGDADYDFAKVGPELNVFWGHLRYSYAREELEFLP